MHTRARARLTSLHIQGQQRNKAQGVLDALEERFLQLRDFSVLALSLTSDGAKWVVDQLAGE